MNQQLKFKIFSIPTILILVFFSWNSIVSAQENNKIVATVAISICGNGVIEGGEICDLANLNNVTCEDLGYAFGELKCSISCDEYEILLCSNITKEIIEQKTVNEVKEDKNNSEIPSLTDQQIIKQSSNDILGNKQSLSITEIYNSNINYEEIQIIENSNNNQNAIILDNNIISRVPT